MGTSQQKPQHMFLPFPLKKTPRTQWLAINPNTAIGRSFHRPFASRAQRGMVTQAFKPDGPKPPTSCGFGTNIQALFGRPLPLGSGLLSSQVFFLGANCQDLRMGKCRPEVCFNETALGEVRGSDQGRRGNQKPPQRCLPMAYAFQLGHISSVATSKILCHFSVGGVLLGWRSPARGALPPTPALSAFLRKGFPSKFSQPKTGAMSCSWPLGNSAALPAEVLAGGMLSVTSNDSAHRMLDPPPEFEKQVSRMQGAIPKGGPTLGMRLWRHPKGHTLVAEVPSHPSGHGARNALRSNLEANAFLRSRHICLAKIIDPQALTS